MTIHIPTLIPMVTMVRMVIVIGRSMTMVIHTRMTVTPMIMEPARHMHMRPA
jgi:hypothetical protein